MKYEYKVLADSETKGFTIEDVNSLGKDGWRVHTWRVSDSGLEIVLFERVTKE